MASLRMALTARDGHAPALFALLDGQFTDFTGDRYQLQADVITDLDPGRIVSELDQGRLVIARS